MDRDKLLDALNLLVLEISDIKNKQEELEETIEIVAESSVGEGFIVGFDILKEYHKLTGETPTFMGIT